MNTCSGRHYFGYIFYIEINRKISRIFAILMAFALLFVGLAQSTLASENPSLASGHELYQTYCTLCHGDEGEGYVADNAVAIGNQDFLTSVSDGFLNYAIANGRTNTPMAAYSDHRRGPLSSAEITTLVAYIRSWQTEPMIDLPSGIIVGDAEAGKTVFSDNCASCHGASGEGISAVSLNSPEFILSALDSQIKHTIINGRRGTEMPPFGEKMPDQTVNDVVSYILTLKTVDLDIVSQSSEVVSLIQNPDGFAPIFELIENRYVPAQQLDAAMSEGAKFVLLDARPTSEWVEWHIPGATSAPYYEPEKIISKLPRNGTWIVSYCDCPTKMSDELTDALRAAGFANTAVLAEGVGWWRRNGYPVIRGSE